MKIIKDILEKLKPALIQQKTQPRTTEYHWVSLPLDRLPLDASIRQKRISFFRKGIDCYRLLHYNFPKLIKRVFETCSF